MKIAYLDCFSGISGDMFLGALLDAGLSLDKLNQCLCDLPLDDFNLQMTRVARNQVFGTRFVVKVKEREQTPRDFKTIRKIIRQANLSGTAKDKCLKIFEDIARVEGKIHNLPLEEVHFHEVGAVDSIIDIIGTVYGLEQLEIDSLFVSFLPLGSGFIETEHGRMPVPAPATIELLNDIPVFDSGVRHEIVTPTGAALVKGLARSFGPMPPMVVRKIGYGAGKRDLPDRPNLLRILIGHRQLEQKEDTIVVLKTNLDDTNPEWLGYLMDRLFDAGALDVLFFPVQMKKNRPGVQVQIMGRPDQRDTLMEILFRESPTLGIQFQYMQRKILERSAAEIGSPWGKIKVKKVVNKDGSTLLMPEYESCRKIALNNKLPLRDIFYWVMGLNKEKW